MKLNAKRALSILLSLLMILSMLTGIVLPASAEVVEESSPYDQIKTEAVEGSTALAPTNAIFVNPAFGTGDYVGTFTYTYGDGETFGNGKTYQLTYEKNAFKNLYEAVWLVRDTWNAADTTVADYNGPDTIVLAPGEYGGNQWQKQADKNDGEWNVYDLPTDWDNGAYYDLFTLNVLGPQAGVSPVTDEIDHADPKPQNGRSIDTSREAVSTSTLWEPMNVQYIVDGIAFAKTANFYGAASDATPYFSSVFKNIYHYANSFYKHGIFRGAGAKMSRNQEYHNYYLQYAQLTNSEDCTPTAQQIIATRLVMDNFYEDSTEIEYVTDGYAQGYQLLCYPTATVNQRAGFLGEDVTGAHWTITNCTINNHATNHWMRFNLTGDNYKTAEADSINITYKDNLFYNCGDSVRSTSKYVDNVQQFNVIDPVTTADPTGYSDTISFQNDWTMETKGALNFTFANNTLEYTLAAMNDAYDGNGGTKAKTSGGAFFNINANNMKDINDQFVNWNMYANTLIYPSEASLTARIYLMAASYTSGETMVKNNVWDYSHLLLNEKGEVCTFWPSYHLVNDLYAGDDYAGGVKELFTVVDGAEMAIANNSINLRAANEANGLPVAGFEGTLMIVPEADAANYNADELFKFRGEKVEVVKLLDDEGTEVTGKVNPNDLDGYKVVAQYKGKTTTCTVTLTVTIAPESEYAFIDPTGTATEYTFNGKTYTLSDSNRWIDIKKDNYAAIKSAGKNVIVLLPGEYQLDNYQFQYNAAILGPQFGVSPVADDFSLSAERDGLKKVGENNYTVDTTKEAYITDGYINVYYTEAAIYIDGLSFRNTEINLQAASFSWGYAKNGSLTSVTMNNCFVNGWDNSFIGSWSDAHLDMIAKQAVYVSDLYAAGLGAEDGKSLINVGAANVEVDHIYVENKKTNCLFRTKGSNGKRMLIHPQIATFELTDSKMSGINDSYNFIYPNFASSTANNSWQGTPFSADPEYYPGGFKILYDNNIFENCLSVTNPAKDYMIRSAFPNTTAYMASIFTNNTVVYDVAPELGAKNYFYQPSMEGNMVEHVLSGNKFINANATSNLYVNYLTTAGEKVDISENYWAVIEDGVEKLVTVKVNDERYATKADWYYVDRDMTVKNTEVALVDNNYKVFTDNGFDGMNNYVIDATGTTGDVFKAVEGASVVGIYSDAGCTQATQPTTGTVYVLVKKGDASLANKVELTYCDHVGKGTTEEITKEPGCNTTGTKAIKCAECGAVLSTEDVAATEQHVPDEEPVVTTAPTCYQNGEGYTVCKFCSTPIEYGVSIPATQMHNWADDWSKDASGHYHACTTENCPAKDEVIVHTAGELIVDTEATCSAKGEGHKECSACGYVVEPDIEIDIDADAHKWETEYTVDTPATCGAAGSKSIRCEYCDAKKADSDVAIPATGEHTAGELIVDTEATCSAKGVGHKNCTVCGGVAESNVEIDINADAHKWETEYTVDVEATCNAAGSKSIHCEYCDTKKTDTVTEIAATGNHTAGDLIVDTAATCVDAGVGHKNCTVCGQLAESNVAIPATGKHSWDNGVVTKEPTTTKKGVKTFTCSVCSATKTEEIAKLAPKVSFTDVKKSDFYYDAVQWAVALGVTTGTSKTTFGPSESCTRAQAVTFLWRAAGQPAAKSSGNPFKDIKKSDYYYKAVLWAAENGVTSGTTKTTFGPNEVCTRGQIVTFLWRAQGAKKVSASNPFKDIKKSDFYYNAVLWAVKNGVTTGTSATTFGPSENCTRGQIVTFLHRAVAK